MKAAATLAVALVLLAAPAVAQERASGCDGFAWDIAPELAKLTGPAQSGDGMHDRTADTAISAELLPLAQAALLMPPEREPDPGTYAGTVAFAAGTADTYRISLSAAAWIDVVQDGTYVKSGDFTGATDCTGIRKSVEFAIGPGAFVVQLSDAPSADIRMALTPAD